VVPDLVDLPRQVVRGVLFDGSGRVLLVQHKDVRPADPSDPETLLYWVPPGGGQEGGETAIDALKREVTEEAGVDIKSVGPCVWVRRGRLVRDGEPRSYVERYFLCQVPPGHVARLPTDSRERIVDRRWWSLEAIAQSQDTFFPDGLASLLKPLRDGDVPEAPRVVS